MRNTKTIRIDGHPAFKEGTKDWSFYLNEMCHLRTANKVGDIENINHYQFGMLKYCGFQVTDLTPKK